ncbi:MAG: GNAT family N-acetyltransferase [Nitriliruptor sp.]|uniref:GNAT family N-acetyltransferase n=1 Tax=Nitriliruptor sp. TaxID=2448056 RepID=UPI00349FDD8E
MDEARDDRFAVLPGGWSREIHLRDGSPALLRQIRPADRDDLAEGIRRLSPASRYLRFQRVVEELSDEQLRYLTDVDHHDHEAIVALDRCRPDRPGIGVARYIREPFEPTVAEAAITVADEYHGQGAGTLLLGALAARARAAGIEIFRSYVLAGNTAMLEVFDHLGAVRELETDGLWRVDLSVPEEDGSRPRSGAERAFHEAARDQQRLISYLPPIWSRRRRERTASDLGEETARAGTFEDDDTDELLQLRAELEGWLGDRDGR